MFSLHLQIQQTDHIEKTSAIRWFKWIVAPQRMNADLQRDQQLARYLTSKEFQSNETSDGQNWEGMMESELLFFKGA